MARTNNYLGVDFGASGLKMVNLSQEKNKISLATYGFTERAPEEIMTDWFADPAATANLLKKICEKAGATTNQAITALPIAAVFHSVISLPTAAAKELEAAVKWEAKKLIPLPLDEIILDWKLLSFAQPVQKSDKETSGEKEEKNLEILLTGAPKSLVQKYVDVFKRANLNLLSLETEAFAFIRSLIGNDPSPAAVVDLGARKSNIIFVDRGVPLLSRSIEVGGQKFTESIAQILNIPLGKAEEIKRNISEVQAVQNLPKIIQEILTPLLNEIKYIFNVYRTSNAIARPIEKIILTGGSALLPHLTDYFTEYFNLRTFLGDPWARLNYPPDLKPLLQAIGSRFTVAIGLAMREL